MGINQSREDTEPILKLLRSIPQPIFETAESKLIDLSRVKCKMHVTKWELLLILQMNSRDIKTIGQFITGEADPLCIDISSLYFLLVLTNQQISLMDKIECMVRFIIFEVGEEGSSSIVAREELRYVFQLAYALLSRITDLDLIQEPLVREDQDSDEVYGCQAEQSAIASIFGKTEDQAELSIVVAKLSVEKEVQKFFQIFQIGKSSDSRLDQTFDGSLNQASGGQKQSLGLPGQDADPNRRAGSRDQRMGDPSKKGDGKDDGSKLGKDKSFGDKGLSDKRSSKNETTSQGKMSKHNMRVNITKIQSTSRKNEGGLTSDRDPLVRNEESAWGVQQRMKQSPHSLIKMSKRILELRNENLADIQVYDFSTNLQKLKQNLMCIKTRMQDSYASRQLLPFMLTLQAERKDEEVSALTAASMIKQTQLLSSPSSIDVTGFCARRYLRNSFESFILRDFCLLKYQNSVARAQMHNFLAEGNFRGRKRELEYKKFKVLGQIQTLKSMFSCFVESQYETEILQGDPLYQNIYIAIHNLYLSQIDHKFLINFIELKNKKRESRRYINFLEGANEKIKAVTKHNTFSYDPSVAGVPQLFQEAESMVEDKLKLQMKDAHIKLVKQYQFQKVQVLNYFTNLGKLKAFYKIMNYNKRSVEDIKQMFDDQIKKLRLKLEKVDSLLVDLVRSQQLKQQVHKQYFFSLGQLSVIKCGIRGLDFSHIFDYFALSLISIRTQESCWLMFDIKNQKDEKAYEDQLHGSSMNGQLIHKLNAHEIAGLIKLQKMKFIDKHFNVGFTESDDSINYDKFHDELEEMAQKNLKISNQIPAQPTPLSDKAKSGGQTGEMIPTVAKNSLKRLYDTLGCSEQFKSLSYFIDNGKKQSFGLDYNHVQKNMQATYTKLLKDLDKMDHFIFDFIPITEAGESMDLPEEQDEQDRIIMNHMTNVSSSFKNIQQDDQRKALNKEKKQAYKLSVEYLDNLRHFEETEYEELFKQQRDEVFLDAIKAVFKMNKKNFLNGFNLIYLSLPIEHSPQNNYQAYQYLKMYIMDQKKFKILQDMALVAVSNEIPMPSLIQQGANIQEQLSGPNQGGQEQLINIAAQGSSRGVSSNQMGCRIRNLTSSRINDTKMVDLFNLVNNSENLERRAKQLLFSDFIQQLDHQIFEYTHQITIYQDIMNKLQDVDNDMTKMRSFLTIKIERYMDEKILSQAFEDYLQTYINFNKTSNQKSIESVLQGAIRYGQLLRDIFNKEMNDTELAPKSKQMTEFLQKLVRDVTNVQSGLKSKFKIQQEELLKQRAEGKRGESPQKTLNQSMIGRKGGSAAKQPASPTKSPQKPRGDMFELEMKDKESTIMEQIVQMFTFYDLLIASRQHHHLGEFPNTVRKKLSLANKKKERIELFKKYIISVAGLADNPTNNLEGQMAQESMQIGALMMNNVLSGNLVNQIDIFQQSPQQSMPETPEKFRDSAVQLTSSRNGGKESLVLTQQQKGLNYLINFLGNLTIQEDVLSGNRQIENNLLFSFSQLSWVKYLFIKQENLQLQNMRHALANLLNIYEIQRTPIHKYLEVYDKQSLFVKRDLFKMVANSNSKLMVSHFHEIITKKGTSIAKSVINKIDEIFSEAVLDDEEKTDFSNAQTKLRRSLDQDLRAFREYLEAESNKKMTEFYESARKQHDMKVAQSITSLCLIVKIYYLKQIQQQDDFLYSLEQDMRSQKLLTFQGDGDEGSMTPGGSKIPQKF